MFNPNDVMTIKSIEHWKNKILEIKDDEEGKIIIVSMNKDDSKIIGSIESVNKKYKEVVYINGLKQNKLTELEVNNIYYI